MSLIILMSILGGSICALVKVISLLLVIHDGHLPKEHACSEVFKQETQGACLVHLFALSSTVESVSIDLALPLQVSLLYSNPV